MKSEKVIPEVAAEEEQWGEESQARVPFVPVA